MRDETTGQPSWGARPQADGTWSFALWAPGDNGVVLELEGQDHPMERGADGVHRCHVQASEGQSYQFRRGELRFADPASLCQRDGVEGPSQLMDPARLAGRSARRVPPPFATQVITELHIGSFTAEGAFAAAARAPELARLADLGITAIEIMPIGQFPGRWGWGYDSVLPWAPQHSYGSPEDLALLIDRAHDLGLSVYLDVVFNHFGPLSCALIDICPEFFHDDETEWGRKINFGHPQVRSFFIDCAVHWLETYHFDGLRFDAVHALDDGSKPSIVMDLAQRIRARVPTAHLIAEDSDHMVHPFEPEARAYDARWDDDYHHALHVLLTGESFGYYEEFLHAPLPDLALALRDGQALQGQPRPGQTELRGAPSAHLPLSAFVKFNLNHDHAGNRPTGARLISLVGPEVARVAHAFLLTLPYVPLLFVGEEVGSRSPFPFFADYSGKLADDMRQSRLDLFKALPDQGRDMLDPFDPATFTMARPYSETSDDADDWLNLTQRILQLRRDVLLPIFARGRSAPTRVQVTGPKALTVAWTFGDAILHHAVDFGPVSAPVPAGDFLVVEGAAPGPWFRLWLDG